MIKKTLFAIALIASVSTFSQEKEEISKDSDLAAKIQNPVAALISIPFQNNYDFGENIDPTNTMNFQPVVPFQISENVNLITRTIIPVISKPFGTDRINGIGNITLSTFFTPAKAGKIIWGVGPAFMFPTLKDGIGIDKFGIAPSIVALYQKNRWTYGMLFQNFFGVAGNSNVDLNHLTAQIFITKNLSKGWYVNTAPIFTADWNALDGEKWTVPLGAGFGRLFKMGKVPVNSQLGFYKYIEHPPGSADYQIRAQIVLLFPK